LANSEVLLLWETRLLRLAWGCMLLGWWWLQVDSWLLVLSCWSLGVSSWLKVSSRLLLLGCWGLQVSRWLMLSGCVWWWLLLGNTSALEEFTELVRYSHSMVVHCQSHLRVHATLNRQRMLHCALSNAYATLRVQHYCEFYMLRALSPARAMYSVC
jgi:hypothetical protein